MPAPQMKREFVRFASRQDRPRFLSQRFSEFLDGKLLDVGCDEAILREFVGAENYVGIDRSDAADINFDLSTNSPLPFADNEYEVVVCTDVLEHLDNLHQVFDEIVRVASRRILISLPNNWNAARRKLERGHGSFKHYGLPLDEPIDRHRWFFNMQEARDFLSGQAERHSLNISEMLVLEKPRSAALRFLRRVRHPNLDHYLNRYSHTLVCAYEF